MRTTFLLSGGSSGNGQQPRYTLFITGSISEEGFGDGVLSELLVVSSVPCDDLIFDSSIGCCRSLVVLSIADEQSGFLVVVFFANWSEETSVLVADIF